MPTAQQELEKQIQKTENEQLLENLKCFVMGMKAQENLEHKRKFQSDTKRNANEEA